jgi:hypothetical protein
MEIQDNAIYVQATVNNKPVVFVIDTGDAIGPVFNAADAETLALPNLGPLGVSGAGGSVQIYSTKANISLGGDTFQDEPSAVDSMLQGNSLLGLPFFIKQGGVLAFDFAHMTVTFGPSAHTKTHRKLSSLLEEWFHRDTGDALSEE